MYFLSGEPMHDLSGVDMTVPIEKSIWANELSAQPASASRTIV
jgi:hypothetical protein